ncbi:hypothetical protein PVAND_011235 [Polypedilum vanderplanki]|uniref:Major facilitator superfamily (MFS) profile domain-containing protein n=1 Tax=Polypedilum vanderplanki TaxID=319348 RepID=A0A9J6CJB8_POLVA|nr:hypothetical protein PVAND_011235 [Polypedilum vanderplanki]
MTSESLINNNNNVIIVSADKNIVKEEDTRKVVEHEPPDSGFRAYIVAICAFLCNGIIFGIINTYSVIYLSLQKQLVASGDDANASSKAALVGSLTIGATFFFSPVSGILVDKLGLRRTTFLGGILTTCGMMLSAYHTDDPFQPEKVTVLCFTYGLLFGTGAALAYTPTLAILGHYFKKKLGIVNGFVTAGSNVFTFILPQFLTHIEEHYGLKNCLRVMMIMSSFIIVCALIYKPLQPPPPKKQQKANRSSFYNFLRSIINFDNWKKKKYVVWAISIPVALFGYFVPYVHIGKFIEEKFPDENKNLPLMCIGITSGLGRIIFGWISDLPNVNRIFLQQISFYFIGLMTIFVPLTDNYIFLLFIVLALGLFDGCFISLLGPIAYELCGSHGAAQAIGFLLGLCSFGLTAGPPIAGEIYDSTKSYTLPFILAGIPPLVGASLMFIIRALKDERKISNDVIEAQPLQTMPQIAWDKENKQPIEERRATLAEPDE